MNLRAWLLLFIFTNAIPAADPGEVRFWSADQMQKIDSRIATKVDPARHLGSERFMDSAFEMYRVGPSEGEIHEKLADFIVVREGEGTLLIGGKLIGGKPSGPDEQRGPAIEGGQKYQLRPADVIYVPANTPHQFLVEPRHHFVATIVKITPKR
jgi:mannose-6-phosphate isomerase-like protein (cupin superfamily)